MSHLKILWSFSSWQLQNASVGPNEMCTGKVKVLGMYDKTVGLYVKYQTNCRYILYIDMTVTAVYVMTKTWKLVV
jgi:hypothetical protein